MIKPEQVPKDAMYAAWKAMNAGMTLNDAIAAALNAWPEAKRVKGYFTHDADYYEPAFILPFMEKTDDQA